MITIKPSLVRWQQPGPLLVECAACENSSEQSCAARRHGATGERGAGAVRRHCHPDCGHGVGITITPPHLHHPTTLNWCVTILISIFGKGPCLMKVPNSALVNDWSWWQASQLHVYTYRIFMFTLPFSIVPTTSGYSEYCENDDIHRCQNCQPYPQHCNSFPALTCTNCDNCTFNEAPFVPGCVPSTTACNV